jgi:hypothetical protein
MQLMNWDRDRDWLGTTAVTVVMTAPTAAGVVAVALPPETTTVEIVGL